MGKSHVDILGNTVSIGDHVVYPQQSGRSVQMMVGQVVGISDRGIQITRLEGSRWDRKPVVETRYIDKRSGKGIDPWATDKHTEERGHTQNGEWIPTKFKDYVEVIQVPARPVTVRNISNVIRVDYKGERGDV